MRKLEGRLGVASPPGSLSLGQVVFEPTALRVSQLTGRLGGSANGPVLTATSDRHVVTIPLDAAQQSEVRAGDRVTVTALLARSPGGYDVEVVGPGNTRRYVPVSVGIFDDADGLVQVSGVLTPGQRVVVAAS